MAISDAVRTSPVVDSITGSGRSRSDFEVGLGTLVPAFTVVDARVASMSRAAAALLGSDVKGDALNTLFRVVEGPPINAVLDGTWGATVVRLEAPVTNRHYRVRAIGDVSGDTMVLLEDCTEEYRVRAQLRLSTEALNRIEKKKLAADENELLRQPPTAAPIAPRTVDLTEMVAAALHADRLKGTTTLLMFCAADRVMPSISTGETEALEQPTLLERVAEAVESTIDLRRITARPSRDEVAVLVEGIADPTQAVAALDAVIAAIHLEVADPRNSDRPQAVGRVGAALGGHHTEASSLLTEADRALFEARGGDRSFVLARPRRPQSRGTETPRRNFLADPRPSCEPLLGLGGNAGTLAGFSHRPTEPIGLLTSLTTACAVMRRSGLQDTSILTVALTLEDHRSPSLASDVLSVLRTQGVRPGQLFLEIPAEDVMTCDSHTKGQLDTLRRYGVGITVSGVDDTSPLLEQLHHLAIDGVILAPLGDRADDSDRYTRTVRRAQDRDLVVWADGVDNLEQYLRAADLGASVARGRVFDHR